MLDKRIRESVHLFLRRNVVIPLFFTMVFTTGTLVRRYRNYFYAWLFNFPVPKYRVFVEKNAMVPMKDKIRLATDIYRPKNPGKYPVILVRTPYNKTGNIHPYKVLGELFASHGYVFVVQDVRGKFKSEGEFSPYINEALDGDMTVTWAGEAPWSNGRVGFFGFSYLGSCAWLAAKHKNPYLKTIVSMFTTQSTYAFWFNKGVPFLKGPLLWLSKYGETGGNKKIQSLANVLLKLPVNELDIETNGHKIHFYSQYLKNPYPNSFWKAICAQTGVDDFNIPTYFISGWYDPFLRGALDDYQGMLKTPASSKSHLSVFTIGPWGHNPAHKFKEISFGKLASFNPLVMSTLEWFEYWLKEHPSIKQPKPIRYFLMGKNEWKEDAKWPPRNVTYKKYYLSMQKGTLFHKRGLLSTSKSSVGNKHKYIYNPLDPVFFRGSEFFYTDKWIEPCVQDEFLTRGDILFYYTPPLKKELVIAGPIDLILYVSSSAVDTDFAAKISDVDPSGSAYNLSTGFLRMRYRDFPEKPKLMKPGQIYKIQITLRSTANAFLKNHRIQLQITSSDFPVYDRNLNTGKNCESSTEIKEAIQTIYTGGQYQSYLLLPVLGS